MTTARSLILAAALPAAIALPASAPTQCTVYSDLTQFELDHGPFARALASLEDYELTNGSARLGCNAIPSEQDADCEAAGDATGFFCATRAIDAGDVLGGLRLDTAPARGPGFDEQIAIGPGTFPAMVHDRFILPNYFGDVHRLELLEPSDPTCPGPVLPTVVGLTLEFSSAIYQPPLLGAEVEVELVGGGGMRYTVPAPANGRAFTGICCASPVAAIRLTDNDGYNIGVEDVRWGQAAGACP